MPNFGVGPLRRLPVPELRFQVALQCSQYGYRARQTPAHVPRSTGALGDPLCSWHAIRSNYRGGCRTVPIGISSCICMPLASTFNFEGWPQIISRPSRSLSTWEISEANHHPSSWRTDSHVEHQSPLTLFNTLESLPAAPGYPIRPLSLPASFGPLFCCCCSCLV